MLMWTNQQWGPTLRNNLTFASDCSKRNKLIWVHVSIFQLRVCGSHIYPLIRICLPAHPRISTFQNDKLTLTKIFIYRGWQTLYKGYSSKSVFSFSYFRMRITFFIFFRQIFFIKLYIFNIFVSVKKTFWIKKRKKN